MDISSFLTANGSWIPPPTMYEETIVNKSPDESADDKNVWLFNIRDDPFEHMDLSDTRQDIVKYLLDRLVYYNSTAVPARYPPPDPKSNPALHGNAWVPWE